MRPDLRRRCGLQTPTSSFRRPYSKPTPETPDTLQGRHDAIVAVHPTVTANTPRQKFHVEHPTRRPPHPGVYLGFKRPHRASDAPRRTSGATTRTHTSGLALHRGRHDAIRGRHTPPTVTANIHHGSSTWNTRRDLCPTFWDHTRRTHAPASWPQTPLSGHSPLTFQSQRVDPSGDHRRHQRRRGRHTPNRHSEHPPWKFHVEQGGRGCR